jgi:hypothetical protein
MGQTKSQVPAKSNGKDKDKCGDSSLRSEFVTFLNLCVFLRVSPLFSEMISARKQKSHNLSE